MFGRRLLSISLGCLLILMSIASGGILTNSSTVKAQETIAYYVSPDGSDENSGTINEPFRTIQKAQTVVRATIAGGMSADVTVFLREGVYPLTSRITFTNLDSGRDGYTVQYVAFPGETPIIDSGITLTDWQAVDGNIYKTQIDPGWILGTMYENGERSNVARHPDKGEIREGYLRVAAPMVTEDPRKQFRFNEGDIPEGLVADGSLEVYIWPGGLTGIYNWTAQLIAVDAIDYDQRIITLASNALYELGPGSRYYIQNSEIMLDAPGEFYADTATGTLYYWPRELPIQDQQIVAPRLTQLIEFKGSSLTDLCENMRIEGITIRNSNYTRATYGYSSGILLQFAKNITIKDNHIHGLGSLGIDFRDLVQDCLLYGNLIHDIGFNAIHMQGAGHTSTNMNNNQITNNMIHNVGVMLGHGHGIRVANTQNNIVSHNRIFDSTRYAISIKNPAAHNNLVQYNDLFDVNKDSQDTGVIEAFRTGSGNVIDHNRVYNSNIYFSFGFGIYLDDAANNFTVSNNIIHGLQQSGNGRTRNAILSKGIGNQFINNYLVNNQAIDLGPFGSSRYGNDHSYNKSLSRNIFYNSGDFIYHFHTWQDNRIIAADHQLIYNDSGNYSIAGAKGAYTFNDWKEILNYRFDQLSLFAPPEFMDESKNDYRLRYDSPARKLGIQEIDFANMGLLDTFKFGDKTGPLEYIYPITTVGKTLTLVSLANGETMQMDVMGRTLTGLIADLSSATITYSSSAPDIASVDASSGLITGVSAGLATVSVAVSRGSELYETFIHVFVEDPLNTLEVRAARNKLKVGEQSVMNASGTTQFGAYTSFSFDDEEVVVTNHNPDIISIDSQGKITALASGDATIEMAFTKNNITVIGQETITVFVPINAYANINPNRSSDYSDLTVADDLLSNTAPGSWVLFEYVDFSKTIPNRLLMEAAVPDTHAGGVLEIRLDSVNGPLLGTVTMNATEGWTDFQQQSTVLNGALKVTGVHHVYLVFSESNSDTAGDIKWIRFARVPVPPSAPWQFKDYGNNTVSTIDNIDDSYTIVTNGNNIWGTSDTFTYIYQNISQASANSMSIITTVDYVNMTSTESSAGVMIRNEDTQNSINVVARIKPNGQVHLTWRANDTTDYVRGTPTIAYPATLRLDREGDVFTAFYLDSHGDWIRYGQVTASMSGDVMAGMIAFSHHPNNVEVRMSNTSIQKVTVEEYTLTKETTTNGTLTFNPNKDAYVAGEAVTITAIPDAGYRLVNFTGASTSTANPVTIIMDADKTIGAIFEPIIGILPAKGVIDRPSKDATVSGTTAITGWFLDGVAVETVKVLLNGQVVGTAQYGITRNDVAIAYPEYGTNSAGFHYALNTTLFNNGSYTLSVQVTDENGEVKTLPARTIIIANPLKAFGTIDRPSIGAQISGKTAVTGWFLNDKGVEKVEVLIDGTVVGEATYGITRNDVAAAYPVYNNSTAGYQYILDTTAVINGTYTLTIEVTDSEGIKTTLPARTVTVNNVLPSIGTIDFPTNGAEVSGIVFVSGWYLDPNGVDKIEVLIDDVVIGVAQYGFTRNDVFAVYGAYNNAQAGFNYMLITSMLDNGEQTLTIRVTDLHENTKTLPSRTITVENE